MDVEEEKDISFTSTVDSRAVTLRMKNIGRGKHARERETREGKGTPSREAHQNRFPPPTHQIAPVKEICI